MVLVEVELVGQLEEQLQALVDDLGDPGVRAVGLVDHQHDGQAGGEGLAQHETGLRQRALGGVDEQQDAVHHGQPALDLAAEVGVAGRVDDVDGGAVPVDRRVLGEDRDALLALQVAGVEDAVDGLGALAEGAGRAQHGVDERGLAVVDVGDDGDVAQAQPIAGSPRPSGRDASHPALRAGRPPRIGSGRWPRPGRRPRGRVRCSQLTVAIPRPWPFPEVAPCGDGHVGGRRHTRSPRSSRRDGDRAAFLAQVGQQAQRGRRPAGPVRHGVQLREADAARQHSGPQGAAQQRGAPGTGLDGGVEQCERADGHGEPAQDDHVARAQDAALRRRARAAAPGQRRGTATVTVAAVPGPRARATRPRPRRRRRPRPRPTAPPPAPAPRR